MGNVQLSWPLRGIHVAVFQTFVREQSAGGEDLRFEILRFQNEGMRLGDERGS